MLRFVVTTPLLEECEDDTHTPEMGTWEFSRTPKTSKFNCKGQNTSPWGVLHDIGKLLNFRCQKWPHMSHLDICSTSYGKKKGRESNWQFDSWPPKVGNRSDPGVCRWSATRRATSLLHTSSQLEVWVKSYELTKSWESKPERFGTLPWESQDKKPFGCGCCGVTQKILYGGRWWLPPSPGRG
jgi:hypothetical protein